MLCYRSDVKLGSFRSQLEASLVSSNTEELWYSKAVCLWMNIYIYIYVCVCVISPEKSSYEVYTWFHFNFMSADMKAKLLNYNLLFFSRRVFLPQFHLVVFHWRPLRTQCRSCRSVMAKVLDYELEVSKFKIQSCYYVHFRTWTLGKGIDPLPFFPTLDTDKIVPLLFFYKDDFGIKSPTKDGMPLNKKK